MSHIPPRYSCAGDDIPADGLAEPRVYLMPRLVVVSRSDNPPIPGQKKPLVVDDSDQEGTQVEQGTKGELRAMSNKSKLNLARLLSSLNFEKLGCCLHVTLTYHVIYPRTKDAIAVEKARLTRDLGRLGVWGIWRLEFQARGALHWHLLVWCCPGELDSFQRALRSWWAGFSGNDSHQGVYISVGREGRAAWYLALHAAKDEQSPDIPVGRWWGYFNRDKVIAMQEVVQPITLSEVELKQAKRCMRRHGNYLRRLASADRQAFRSLSRGMGIRSPKNYERSYSQGVQGFSWFLPPSDFSNLIAYYRKGLPVLT